MVVVQGSYLSTLANSSDVSSYFGEEFTLQGIVV
jgi:hypothetical protein